jgi:arabinoxylan arabinofuranohydrolase
MKDGDYAGLGALQDVYGFAGVKVENRNKYIVMVMLNASTGTPEEIESVPLTSGKVYLRIDFNFRDAADRACFIYSYDETIWQPIGGILHMEYKLTHFTGYRFALFYYSTQNIGGHADFDYFRLSDRLLT